MHHNRRFTETKRSNETLLYFHLYWTDSHPLAEVSKTTLVLPNITHSDPPSTFKKLIKTRSLYNTM